MRTLQRSFSLAVLPLLLILGVSAGQTAAEADSAASEAHSIGTETHYYGIEINGVLCGYSEISTSTIQEDGKKVILLNHRMFAMLSALGSKFNTEVKLTYHVDPATGRFTYHDSHIKQGPTELGSAIHVRGDTARFTSTLSDKETVIPLPQDVVLENTLFFPHLLDDFVRANLSEKTYDIFEVREAEVQKTTYTKTGAEQIELAGNTYSAIILDRLNHKTGVKATMWIDTRTGLGLKSVLPNNRMSYLADPSVAKRIEMANLDETITAKAGASIADFQAISYMKVKASVQPTGLWVTPESLNMPGQRFTGTVTDNLVEGVFEIEHKRYDGSDAPPFPPDFTEDKLLKGYLEPEELVESNDPVLVEQARNITGGSANSWEAACRLSKWVAENISYAIPGGASARKTYDMKSGECGAHSLLLAAFCRAVGIPARVVWGCMYVPNFGGSFGQHAWNEIYMGKTGWVPVDATASETDYVDSGHIRIGVFESLQTALNPKAMKVLDYRVGTGQEAKSLEGVSDRYAPYLGAYESSSTGDSLTVLVQNGSLTVDIPGKIVLAMNDPDEEGRWYSKATSRLYVTFSESDSGKIVELQIHEMVAMSRTSGPETYDNVPDEFKPYLGKYFLAALNAEFTVFYAEGSLAVNDPTVGKVVKLRLPDDKGRWVDEFGKNAVLFELGEDGYAKSLTIDVISRFRR